MRTIPITRIIVSPPARWLFLAITTNCAQQLPQELFEPSYRHANLAPNMCRCVVGCNRLPTWLAEKGVMLRTTPTFMDAPSLARRFAVLTSPDTVRCQCSACTLDTIARRPLGMPTHQHSMMCVDTLNGHSTRHTSLPDVGLTICARRSLL